MNTFEYNSSVFNSTFQSSRSLLPLFTHHHPPSSSTLIFTSTTASSPPAEPVTMNSKWPSSSLLPTRRELILLAILLVSLLFITNSEFASKPGLSFRDLARGDEEQSALETDVVLANTYPLPRVTWSETEGVPETKLMHHVPGAFSILLCFRYLPHTHHEIQDGQFLTDYIFSTGLFSLLPLIQSPFRTPKQSPPPVTRSSTVKKISRGVSLPNGISLY